MNIILLLPTINYIDMILGRFWYARNKTHLAFNWVKVTQTFSFLYYKQLCDWYEIYNCFVRRDHEAALDARAEVEDPTEGTNGYIEEGTRSSKEGGILLEQNVC